MPLAAPSPSGCGEKLTLDTHSAERPGFSGDGSKRKLPKDKSSELDIEQEVYHAIASSVPAFVLCPKA